MQTDNSFTESTRETRKSKMICEFCKKYAGDGHLCARKFSYEYIFKQMFINILLDHQPRNMNDFYEISVKEIRNNILHIVPNPFNIMCECLKIFVDEYDCF